LGSIVELSQAQLNLTRADIERAIESARWWRSPRWSAALGLTKAQGPKPMTFMYEGSARLT
jgi:hypothetical protein